MDIKLAFNPDITAVPFDLEIENGDLKLATDLELETGTFISLFSDKRAAADDPLPGAEDDKRGWWSDIAGDITTDQIGSKLWLLTRSKNIASVLIDAEEYVRGSLKWMITDGVAKKIDVTVEAVRSDVLGIFVQIYKPNEEIETLSYEYKWSN